MMFKIPSILRASIISLFCFAFPGAASAQQDDVFLFIPEGGRSLLEATRASGLPSDLETDIAKNTGDPGLWKQRLETAKANSPTLAEFDDWQMQTLAHYLAVNAPMDPAGDLPWDGRDMALERCQSCHIITVTITQDRTREAWLGTLNRPSHIEIELSESERGALADYLVLNAGIPIDQVPPELRAGGASY
ncbi:hypothetical protein [Roseibium sp.]|uniref:hypothetical protein n=1 Tax=Roseibium sp. TaxID=1936156 RepID=UPI003A96B75A